jgi:hypothetical protein
VPALSRPHQQLTAFGSFPESYCKHSSGSSLPHGSQAPEGRLIRQYLPHLVSLAGRSSGDEPIDVASSLRGLVSVIPRWRTIHQACWLNLPLGLNGTAEVWSKS